MNITGSFYGYTVTAVEASFEDGMKVDTMVLDVLGADVFLKDTETHYSVEISGWIDSEVADMFTGSVYKSMIRPMLRCLELTMEAWSVGFRGLVSFEAGVFNDMYFFDEGGYRYYVDEFPTRSGWYRQGPHGDSVGPQSLDYFAREVGL